jgi:hypothetical protein
MAVRSSANPRGSAGGGPLDALREPLAGEASASSLFAIVAAGTFEDRRRKPGARRQPATNDNLDGSYAGCVFLRTAPAMLIQNHRPPLQRRPDCKSARRDGGTA